MRRPDPVECLAHAQKALELLREATGELLAASFKAPRVWSAELSSLHRKLLGEASELAQIVVGLKKGL